MFSTLSTVSLATVSLEAQTVVSGTLMTAAGKPATTGIVRLTDALGAAVSVTVTPDASGAFSLSIPHHGAYMVSFAAPQHRTVTVPLLLGSVDKSITAQIQLEPLFEVSSPTAAKQQSKQLKSSKPSKQSSTQHSAKSSFAGAPSGQGALTIKDVRIVGSWNNFNYQNAAAMNKASDGTYTIELAPPADSIEFQFLVEMSNGKRYVLSGMSAATAVGSSVVGTMEFRPMNNYASMFDGFRSYQKVAANKPLVLRFDPALLPRGQQSATVLTFDKEHEYLAEMARLERRTGDEIGDLTTAARKFFEAGGEREKFRYDVAPLQADLRRVMSNDKHPLVLRQFAAAKFMRPLQQFMTGDGRDEAALAIVREVLPASSSAWEIAWEGAIETYARTPAGREEFLKQQPSAKVRARVLINELANAMNAGSEERAKTVFARLKEQFASLDDSFVQNVLKTVRVSKEVAVGKPVPDFEVRLLNDDGSSGNLISNQSLRGKYYMLDFWAVWCGPCRGEMPVLHNAFEKFKDRLTVLSLSFDKTVNDIVIYRKRRDTPMPWLHAFVEKGFESDVARVFEVDGIPKPLLVDPNGMIVAMQDELRGDMLEKTLERVLPKPSAGGVQPDKQR